MLFHLTFCLIETLDWLTIIISKCKHVSNVILSCCSTASAAFLSSLWREDDPLLPFHFASCCTFCFERRVLNRYVLIAASYVCVCIRVCVQEPELGEREDEAEDEIHAGPGGLSGLLHPAWRKRRRQGETGLRLWIMQQIRNELRVALIISAHAGNPYKLAPAEQMSAGRTDADREQTFQHFSKMFQFFTVWMSTEPHSSGSIKFPHIYGLCCYGNHKHTQCQMNRVCSTFVDNLMKTRKGYANVTCNVWQHIRG